MMSFDKLLWPALGDHETSVTFLALILFAVGMSATQIVSYPSGSDEDRSAITRRAL
jgi:hypothetical protein